MARTSSRPARGRQDVAPDQPPVGELLREWRVRRRLSQLELALRTDISTRHLSFVVTGRSRPTSEMIERLCAQLDLPLRERNRVLLAGGYAPRHPETDLAAPEMAAVRTAVRQLLAGHEPYPAVAVDRCWNVVDANGSVALFTDGLREDLLAPPLNALRLSLHPDGMAARIVNLGEWRAHVLGRLRRQVAATADPVLTELEAELQSYPCPPDVGPEVTGRVSVVVPLRYRHDGEELSFVSTTTVFGTPLDVTVAELAIESFFPADEATAAALRRRFPS